MFEWKIEIVVNNLTANTLHTILLWFEFVFMAYLSMYLNVRIRLFFFLICFLLCCCCCCCFFLRFFFLLFIDGYKFWYVEKLYWVGRCHVTLFPLIKTKFYVINILFLLFSIFKWISGDKRICKSTGTIPTCS